MRAIDIALRIITFNQMKRFMESFVTTIGTTVYVPVTWYAPYHGSVKMSDVSKIIILRHERVHMGQKKLYGSFLFSLAYLFLPFPVVFALCRTRFEKQGYEESMRATAELVGIESLDNPLYRRHMIRHFISAEYFWMWPFRKSIERWYDSTVAEIRANHL
jgi:hypothetical protein